MMRILTVSQMLISFDLGLSLYFGKTLKDLPNFYVVLAFLIFSIVVEGPLRSGAHGDGRLGGLSGTE